MKFYKKLDFQLMLPVMTIIITSTIFLASQLTERVALYINKSEQLQIKHLSEHIHYLISGNFETLFYQIGDNEKEFKNREPMIQEETIASIKRLVKGSSDYNLYIRSKNNIISIKNINTNSKDFFNKIDLVNYSIYKKTFLPWNWNIVIIKHRNGIETILHENKKTIQNFFIVMMALVITSIYLTFFLSTKKYISILKNKMSEINKGIYSEFSIKGPYEFELLAQKLNQTINTISNREKEIKDQLFFNQKVMNSQESIIAITSNRELFFLNNKFFEIFNQFSSLEEFLKDYTCICELFQKKDDPSYLYIENFDREYWAELIINSPNHFNKIMMNNIAFSVSVSQIQIQEKIYDIAVFTNINELENYRQDLETEVMEQIHTNRTKDLIIAEQERDIAMSSLLNNIAHQWRQPLNIIALSTQRIEDVVSFQEPIKNISQYVQKIFTETSNLSKTITGFDSLCSSSSSERTTFSLTKTISNIKDAFSVIIKTRNINLIDLSNDIKITTYSKEFNQLILILFQNFIDIILERNISSPTLQLNLSIKNDHYLLSIEDNCGGIKPEIQSSIFDPYVTSSFKSSEKGMGLFQAKNLVKKKLNGTIGFENTDNGTTFLIRISK